MIRNSRIAALTPACSRHTTDIAAMQHLRQALLLHWDAHVKSGPGRFVCHAGRTRQLLGVPARVCFLPLLRQFADLTGIRRQNHRHQAADSWRAQGQEKAFETSFGPNNFNHWQIDFFCINTLLGRQVAINFFTVCFLTFDCRH